MPANMLLYSLCCDIISLKSLKITQAFYLLLGFAENQALFWDFKIRNSVQITEGLDNGDSDNRGPTVYGFYGPCSKNDSWTGFCDVCCATPEV